MAASLYGKQSVVEYLVDHGASVQQTERFSSLITVACSQGHWKTAKYLADKGAQINAFTSSEFLSFLNKYDQEDEEDIIQYFTTNRITVPSEQEAFNQACSRGMLGMARFLANQYGCVVHAIQNKDLFLMMENLPSHLDLDFIEFFHKNGLNLNRTSEYSCGTSPEDYTLFEKAIMTGRVKIMDYLLKQGVLNIKEHKIPSYLEKAALWGHLRVLKYLLEEWSLSTPLDSSHFFGTLLEACKTGNVAIVKYLESKGGKLSSLASLGKPYQPLFAATVEGYPEMVRYLIPKCPYPNGDMAFNPQTGYLVGGDPFLFACGTGKMQLIPIFLELQKPEIKLIEKGIITACLTNHLQVMKHLIENTRYNPTDVKSIVLIGSSYSVPSSLLTAALAQDNEEMLKYLVGLKLTTTLSQIQQYPGQQHRGRSYDNEFLGRIRYVLSQNNLIEGKHTIHHFPMTTLPIELCVEIYELIVTNGVTDLIMSLRKFKPKENDLKMLNIVRLLGQPLKLKVLSRNRIRNQLGCTIECKVMRLPLPKPLKRYLMLES